MFPLLPLPQTLVLFCIASIVTIAAIRWLYDDVWRVPWIRCGLAGLWCVPVAGFAIWQWGNPALAALGVRICWTTLVVLIPLASTLIVSGGAYKAMAVTVSHIRRRAPAPVALFDVVESPRVGRRDLLRIGVGVLPASAVAASVIGFEQADAPPRVPIVTMDFAGLHPDLEGLRILHLTDLHLGASKRASDLEAFFESMGGVHIDLVVATGDLADDPRELEAALEILHARRPRLGVYAILGNHEYFMGAELVRRIYARSSVPLLVDRGVAIEIGDGLLWLAGADDPEREHGRLSMLDESVIACAAGAPMGALRVLLSHRPNAFAAAERHGFNLVLSGHTHGGQIGFGGRSAFEGLLPDEHLWGVYRRGESKLYTSAGFGHWFPFRLGCPTEAPIIVLRGT